MSNYLTNVARRTVGASLLRPRIASRFEPVRGTGPAMNQFREVAIEREVEAPRDRQATEVRIPPPPVSHRTHEPTVRLEEARTAKPVPTTELPQERTLSRKKPDIDQPLTLTLQEARTQIDPEPSAGVAAARGVRPERTQEPEGKRDPISRDVAAGEIRLHPEPARQIPQRDVPVAVSQAAVSPLAPQFPAPATERREAIDRPALPRPFVRPDSPVRGREIPAAPSAGLHTQFAPPQIEIAARDVHVVIGKVTVQATFPTAAAPPSSRAAASGAPRLTLERYLDRRGGRP